MKLRFLILFSGWLLSNANAQDVSVRAILDTNKGLIGDQFLLRMQVEKPSDSWTVTFPDVAKKLTGEIEIIRIKPVDTTTSGARQILVQDLFITVFDTGFFEIPALKFGITHATFNDTVSTLPVSFEIMAMKSDSTIRDIKAIYTLPLSFREVAPYIGAAVVLFLVIWFLIRFFRNRKIREKVKTVEVYSEPADVIALQEIARLKEEKPWLNNRIKYYYIRISDILRTYIEHHYHTLAMEQTTGEILNSLKNKSIEPADLNRLSDMLKLADLVKFAKVIPDPEQNATQVGQAEEFVRNTARPVSENITSEEVSESNRNQ